jgi:CheY-like chemotaxis protein
MLYYKPMKRTDKEPGLVLVVDDDPDYLTIFQAALAKFGIEALGATSGPEALKLAREQLSQLSIIFLDMRMPEMNGIEVAKQIRAMGYKRTIIAFTAAASISGQTGKKEAEQSGIDRYFSKEALRPALIEALVNEYCL